MTLNMPDDAAILSLIEPLALAAGRRIMEVVAEGFAPEAKADDSPVTKADREAEAIVLAGLRAHFPQVPVVAEEEVSIGLSPDHVGQVFFLVDPLDGTREFVRGGEDFTVNIALVREGAPVVGAVYAPACRQLYLGRPGFAEAVSVDENHHEDTRRKIFVRKPAKPLVVVASRSHRTRETDAYIAGLGDVEFAAIGSSLKFCLLADGRADLYPRLGRTMQWDTAAGDAVLRGAGGMTRCFDGSPLRYGEGAGLAGDPFANPDFLAEGGSGEG